MGKKRKKEGKEKWKDKKEWENGKDMYDQNLCKKSFLLV